MNILKKNDHKSKTKIDLKIRKIKIHGYFYERIAKNEYFLEIKQKYFKDGIAISQYKGITTKSRQWVNRNLFSNILFEA